MVEVDVDRRAALLGQPEARPAGACQLAPQVAGGGQQGVARLALPAGERLELARLLERVEPDLRVAPIASRTPASR